MISYSVMPTTTWHQGRLIRQFEQVILGKQVFGAGFRNIEFHPGGGISRPLSFVLCPPHFNFTSQNCAVTDGNYDSMRRDVTED